MIPSDKPKANEEPRPLSPESEPTEADAQTDEEQNEECDCDGFVSAEDFFEALGKNDEEQNEECDDDGFVSAKDFFEALGAIEEEDSTGKDPLGRTWKFVECEDGAALTACVDDPAPERFPEEVAGIPVREIQDSAFGEGPRKAILIPEGVQRLTWVTPLWRSGVPAERLVLPASLTQIHELALPLSSELQEITVAEGNPAFRAEGGFLLSKDGRKLYRVAAAAMGPQITVPDGVEYIAGLAFAQCSALKTVILPESLSAFGRAAFCACESLQRLTLPPRIETIPPSAFESCTALASLGLPPGLREIRRFAFADCPALRRITLPPTVKDIGDSAFDRECEIIRS